MTSGTIQLPERGQLAGQGQLAGRGQRGADDAARLTLPVAALVIATLSGGLWFALFRLAAALF
jgi:hypothetical protein